MSITTGGRGVKAPVALIPFIKSAIDNQNPVLIISQA